MNTFDGFNHYTLDCPFCGRSLEKLEQSWETAKSNMYGSHNELVLEKGEYYSEGFLGNICKCGASYSWFSDIVPIWEQEDGHLYYFVQPYSPMKHEISGDNYGCLYIHKAIDTVTIKKYIKVLGLSQRKLAEKLKQTEASISKKMSGKLNWSFKDQVMFKNLLAKAK